MSNDMKENNNLRTILLKLDLRSMCLLYLPLTYDPKESMSEDKFGSPPKFFPNADPVTIANNGQTVQYSASFC